MQATITPTNRTDITRKDCILESTTIHQVTPNTDSINTEIFSNNGHLLVTPMLNRSRSVSIARIHLTLLAQLKQSKHRTGNNRTI